MIKVSVLYPYTEGESFDMDYYLGSHMPMVADRLGDALKGSSVEQGLAGGAPGSPPPYVAAGHLVFESVEAFQAAFGPHTAEILGDIPNYTKITPTMQIGEIRL